MLVMMKTLLSTTDILHKYLQKADLDMAKALQYKDAVIQTLRCAALVSQIKSMQKLRLQSVI